MKMLLSVAIAACAAAPLAAAAANPYQQPDDSWIMLNGTVKSTTADSFLLDYGKGVVTVEMDAPGSQSGFKVKPGDKVSVTGMVDDDAFETASIEAATVYVDGLNTHFLSPSSADEEDLAMAVVSMPLMAQKTVVVGNVTDIDGRELTIDTGTRSFRVDTALMGYDPTDKQGFQKLEIGDRVSVIGSIDRDFFEGRELMAESVATLSPLDGLVSN